MYAQLLSCGKTRRQLHFHDAMMFYACAVRCFRVDKQLLENAGKIKCEWRAFIYYIYLMLANFIIKTDTI